MEQNKLIAYHNLQEVKDKYVTRMEQHVAMDNLEKGDSQRCAVGCTLNHYSHKDYETELGVPEWLARVEDSLFEGMSLEKSKTFPLEFLQSITVGADLETIKNPFIIYILEQALTTFDHEKFPDVKKCIDDVIIYHNTDFKDDESAESAARSAAESAARSAESAAWSAARSAESAAWSAESAARSAAALAARSAESAARSAESAWSARSAAFDKYADKLIQLIKDCK